MSVVVHLTSTLLVLIEKSIRSYYHFTFCSESQPEMSSSDSGTMLFSLREKSWSGALFN